MLEQRTDRDKADKTVQQKEEEGKGRTLELNWQQWGSRQSSGGWRSVQGSAGEVTVQRLCQWDTPG